MKHDGRGEGKGSNKEETDRAELWMTPPKEGSFVNKQNTLGPQRAQSVRHRPQGPVTQEKGEARGENAGVAVCPIMQADRSGRQASSRPERH
jgi:hypothetical protein